VPPLPVAADEHGLEVSGAYMQTTIPSRPAAGYFTLKNNGDVDRVLVEASSPGCESVMMHKSESVGGMDKMLMVDSVPAVRGTFGAGLVFLLGPLFQALFR
jgi:periplasmic copper chaperone A